MFFFFYLQKYETSADNAGQFYRLRIYNFIFIYFVSYIVSALSRFIRRAMCINKNINNIYTLFYALKAKYLYCSVQRC